MATKRRQLVIKSDDVVVYTGPGEGYTKVRTMVGYKGKSMSFDLFKNGFWCLENRDGWISEYDVESLADYLKRQ